ncbi:MULTISPECIES: alpha/beta hydrolase [unclassified Corynebacterium]|uniref:alpha/beta hydrolase n=3 Tax=Corynebacterium TaxID=1716 RepID=UPI002649144C|nr:alpha/beta hydrolase [Corynebacterium sp.]MDN5581879.1 alpha/beta hydrolase family protein [Corynebacterium sp.]MDN5719081.1 alpha/beta hydrolase family protein [Corynebacterium sp.]MDN6323864.1 alpha/beta hydrolase family protein [Corynebacterium sp.]MDN6510414.1 alpha/beta hydrolase family protein [Corynebacterium sp.]
MDMQELADAPLEQAAATARQWATASGQMREAAGAVRGHGRLPGWSGGAAEAMGHRIDSCANRVLASCIAAHWVGVVLGHHATLLAAARNQAAPVLGMARTFRMRVSADGTVTPPAPLPPLLTLAAAWSMVLHACRMLTDALDTATAAVVEAASAVGQAPTVTAVDRTALDAATVAELVDPAAAQAAAAAVTMPSGLAVPLDAATEDSLRQAVGAARRELALRGLDPDAVGVTVQELDGQPVVVVGDLHTAPKVTTLVSGVGSSGDGALPGSAGNAGRIGGTGHAVVAWHGYRAPADLGQGLNPSYAGVGAPALRGAQSALRERSADGAELQVVAHSYGTTLLGAAARDPSTPLDADTIHLLGSPGTGVRDTGELHVDALDGHAEVHAWRAPGDLIGATTGANGGVHGRDPTSAGFGADTVNGAPAGQQDGWAGRILGRMTDGYLWTQGEWDSHSSYLADDLVLEQVR